MIKELTYRDGHRVAVEDRDQTNSRQIEIYHQYKLLDGIHKHYWLLRWPPFQLESDKPQSDEKAGMTEKVRRIFRRPKQEE